MDHTTHVLVQQLPLNDDSFETKLKELSDQLNKDGYSQPSIFSQLPNVLDACVSSTHLAFLLEDGRICRLSYTLDSSDKSQCIETFTNSLTATNQESIGKSSKIKIQNTNSGGGVPLNMPSTTSTTTAGAVAAAVALASSTLNNSSTTSTLGSATHFRPQSRSGFRSHETFIIPAAASDILAPITTHSFSRGRGQLLRGRVSSLIMGHRFPATLVPASSVPESLIESVQNVLQSKSRNVIIRELQRTNLDVNLAVNNLLQRDDEGDDGVGGGEDDATADYLHSGDDLISLLDINSHAGGDHSVIIDSDGAVFDEDTLRISRRFGRSLATGTATTTSTTSASGGSGGGGGASQNQSSQDERDRKTYRLREQRWYDTTPREESFANREREAIKSDDTSSKKTQTQPVTQQIVFGDKLEFWHEKSHEQIFFVKIASMFSELIGVSKTGQLYQWKWSCDLPYSNQEQPHVKHPKCQFLNIQSEKVLGVVSSTIRASLWTESGRVATWLDESVDMPATLKLQSCTQQLFDPQVDSLVQLSVCNTLTVARLLSGSVYWWGMTPFSHRTKIIEKFQTKTFKIKQNGQANDIQLGCSVCLKTLPLYNSGTIVMTVQDGQPKMGHIAEHIFSIKDTKLIKIRLKNSCETNDMPPPATPFTSETNASNNLKRKKANLSDSVDESKSKKEEESWCLAESLFLTDDSKSFALGKVIKIDSDYVIVKMHTELTKNELDPLENCRVFQKNQLQVIKSSSNLKLPDFIQKTPKKLLDFGQILTLRAHQDGLHAILHKDQTIYYVFYDYITNKILKERRFPTSVGALLGQSVTNMKLSALDDPSLSQLTLLDGNSTFYPLVEVHGLSNVKDPQWKNLYPVRYYSQIILPNKKHSIALFSMRIEHLITNIFRFDLEKVLHILKSIESDADAVRRVTNERTDGNRNILHAAVYASAPVSNKDCDNTSAFTIPTRGASWGNTNSSGKITIEPFRHQQQQQQQHQQQQQQQSQSSQSDSNHSGDHSYEQQQQQQAPPPLPPLTSTTNIILAPNLYWSDKDSSTKVDAKLSVIWSTLKIEDKDRRSNSIKILQSLLDSSALRESLVELLTSKNAEGATPFMYSVNIRAYHAALLIFDRALKYKNQDPSLFYRIIFPYDSNSNNSPLYVLCCNDTCSFTWTGDNHITQDIFECRTCTLVGNLCCCTECARTCHKGHDCKIKTSSPTAYCDCWEKCKCKSLVAGDQEKRYELLCKLLEETNLLQIPNNRGEHLLLYLAQTVGRQIQEQRHYKRNSSTSIMRKNLDVEMPQHDLEPPRFSRKALDKILTDWTAIRQMIMFNYRPNLSCKLTQENFDDSVYFDNQSGCVDLDKFIHILLAKCLPETLGILLSTIHRELLNEQNDDALNVAKRFVRGVVRNWILMNIECVPSNKDSVYSGSLSNKYKSRSSCVTLNSPLAKCDLVFRQFPSLSVDELISSGNALIAPLLLGISKATNFRPTLQDDTRVDRQSYVLSEELFNVDPPVVRSSSLGALKQSHQTDVQFQAPPPPPSSVPSLITQQQQQQQQLHVSNNLRRLYQPNRQHSTGDNEDDQQSEMDAPMSEAEVDESTRDNYEEMDLNLFAESDTDSDSVTSNRDNASAAQRSAVTGAATVGTGSDPGIGEYFSDEDSDVSSNEEDEDDDSDMRSDILNVDQEAQNDIIQFSNDSSVDSHNRQSSSSWAWRRNANTGSGVATGTTTATNTNTNTTTNTTLPVNVLTSTSTHQNSSSVSNIYTDIHMRRNLPSNPLTSSSTTQPISIQNQTTSLVNESNQPESVLTTNVMLARAFALILRQTRDLLNQIYQKDERVIGFTSLSSLINHINSRLESVWKWLVSLLDANESQLRFGCALSASTLDSNTIAFLKHIEDNALSTNIKLTESTKRKLNSSTQQQQQQQSTQATSKRKDFLNYTLGLLRMGSNEHKESLPQIDICQLKHVAYIFDGLMYYLRSPVLDESQQADRPLGNENFGVLGLPNLYEAEEIESENEMDVTAFTSFSADSTSEEDTLAEQQRQQSIVSRTNAFFTRSESTLPIGGQSPDPFNLQLDDSLPLAAKPHLLQPNSRKQDLFKAQSNHVEQFHQLNKLSWSDIDRRRPILVNPYFAKKVTSLSSAKTKASNDLLDLSLRNFSQKQAASTSGIQMTIANPTDEYFERWRLTLDLFGRVFCDDVGLEQGSIIRQLGGFQIKESRFRREMEKYRNSATKELSIEVERNRDTLIQSTFKALNNLYMRRNASSSNSLPPICISRVKVTFKDEQGEGSGVARSFYTAFAESILANEKLPPLDTSSYAALSSSNVFGSNLNRYKSSRDYKRSSRSKPSDRKLCVNAQLFYVRSPNAPNEADFTLYDNLSPQYREIGERLFAKIAITHPQQAPKITGMLLELKINLLAVFLNSDSALKSKIDEALGLLNASNTDSTNDTSQLMPTQDDDNSPLFWQPDRKGFYSLRPGKNTLNRLNAFRNCGRIIGICLLQNELCPIPLARHIIKYILGQPVKWHDLAFFDSQMYESLRKMIVDAEKHGDSVFKSLELTFNVDLPKEEDGSNYDLLLSGSQIEVNKSNMYEYVKLYGEYRMVKHIEQCCNNLKMGIFDVLPANSLVGLNPEDFRLLLNGIIDINIDTLRHYTSILDESKESSRRTQFEKWFWHTIERMTQQEKQELVFFWTGSPYLPASKEGFQPAPSITLRPPSDQHLPTANTCINRLYLPLYSSKAILKTKLLYAIKTKLFGFV